MQTGLEAYSIFFVVTLLFIYWLKPVEKWRLRKIPGLPWYSPKNWNKFIFESDKDNGIQIVDQYPRLCKRIGASNEIIITDPALIKKAASILENKTKYVSDMIEGTGLGVGILSKNVATTGGSYWFDLRNMFNPAFTSSTIKSYKNVITQCMDDHVQLLNKAYGEDKEIDIVTFTKGMTFQIILKTTFGADIDLSNQDDLINMEQIVSSYDQLFESIQGANAIYIAAFTPKILRPLLKYWPYAVKQFQIMNKIMLHPGYLSYKLLSKKVNYEIQPQNGSLETRNRSEDIQNENTLKSETSNKSSLKNFKDWQNFKGPGLLRLLLEKGLVQGRSLNYTEVLIQILTFVNAGYETTSLTLSCMLWEIANHQEAKEKVLQEIKEFGVSQKATVDDLQKFPYIKACISETLRMYPLLKNSQRICDKQNFSLDGLNIPVGTEIVFPIRGIQLSPRFWPSPQEWRPQRWLGDKRYECLHSSQAFMPFSYGPRMCIGYQLANTELILAVVNIMQNYDLEFLGSQTLEYKYQNEPINLFQLVKPLKCKLNKRYW